MMLTPYMVMPSTPPLCRVMVWGALVSPTIVDAKERLPGETLAPERVPVPESATV